MDKKHKNTQTVSEWNIKIRHRRAALLDQLLLAAVISGLVGMLLLYVGLPEGMSTLERLVEMVPFLASWLLTLIAWIWRGLGDRPRALVLLLLTYILGCIIFARGGLAGGGRVWLLLIPPLAFILLGPRPGIAAGVVIILTYAFFTLAISQKWAVPQVAEDLTTMAPLVSEGGGFLLVVVVLTLIQRSFGQGWLEALAGASAANRQLQAQAQELAEANERLHRQTRELQATAEIARAGSSILDPEKLLAEVVNRIQEGFSPMGVYYVGLFLLDETQQFAVLRAATGEAGQLLLKMGYQLEPSETSTVGWCIKHQQARIAPDVRENTVQLETLSMPHTRLELALPLCSRGDILGALSVQSTQEAAFSEADIAVLQTMADQVAVAIENARLFSQMGTVLEEVRVVQRHYLAQEWRKFLAGRPVTRVDHTQSGTEPGDESFLRECRREALEHGRTVTVDNFSEIEDEDEIGEPDEEVFTSQAALVVPLKLQEQVIGTMTLHETHGRRLWMAEDIALAETIAEQVALTVERLRLLDETQRRAARERLIGEVTGHMRASLDMESVLKTAADEMYQALGLDEIVIRLVTEGTDGGTTPEGQKESKSDGGGMRTLQEKVL